MYPVAPESPWPALSEWRGLTVEELEAFAALCVPLAFRRSDVLFARGEPVALPTVVALVVPPIFADMTRSRLPAHNHHASMPHRNRTDGFVLSGPPRAASQIFCGGRRFECGRFTEFGLFGPCSTLDLAGRRRVGGAGCKLGPGGLANPASLDIEHPFRAGSELRRIGQCSSRMDSPKSADSPRTDRQLDSGAPRFTTLDVVRAGIGRPCLARSEVKLGW